MNKKGQKEKNEKMKIDVSKVNKTEEDVNNKKENEKSQKKMTNKSKSTTKSLKKLEEIKTAELKIENKPIIYNLDYIYRRERYILKNLHSNYLLSKIKKLISKNNSVDVNLLQIYYLDKELTNDKLNVYDLIKNNKIKYFEVKKESPINENIISLNPNANLIYKVKCKGIENAKDFIDKIDIFFREKCLDKHYLCEPVGVKEYDVGFSCEDNCYQFKRYMSIVRKLDPNYINTTYEYVPIDKRKVFRPKLSNFSSMGSLESLYINKGPYITYEDIKRREEREEKKKWVCKKDFLFKRK